MKKNQLAFTLAELVVITLVLIILSTIWFVSYYSSLPTTRDANRLAQIVKIYDWLEIKATTNSLPSPENSVGIRFSWSIIANQWYVWKYSLLAIDYNRKGLDPLDNVYFTYLLSSDKKSFQLLTFLEESNRLSFVGQTYAANYLKRFPKVVWDKFWILLESPEKTPIQEISSIKSAGFLDLNTSVGNYSAYFTDKNVVTWSWLALSIIDNPIKSCETIFLTWRWTVSWNYIISPDKITKENVYCTK